MAALQRRRYPFRHQRLKSGGQWLRLRPWTRHMTSRFVAAGNDSIGNATALGRTNAAGSWAASFKNKPPPARRQAFTQQICV